MKNVKLLSFLLVVTAACAGRAHAGSNDGSADTDSLTQSFTTPTSSAATAGYYGSTSAYFIPVDSANKMLGSYLASINADVDTSTNIQSFIVDADALREYLSDNSIKKVKVMLAHTLNYVNSGGDGVNCGYRAGKLTIILAGYDADKNYIFAPGNKVLDNSIPCPTQCEIMGTAADMTLH